VALSGRRLTSLTSEELAAGHRGVLQGGLRRQQRVRPGAHCSSGRARVARHACILPGMTADPMHDRLLAITLKLPGACEDWPWGSIHCKVDGKIFVGWGRDDDGEMVIGIRTGLDKQARLVASDPRFSIAKFVGKYGGINMRLGVKPDWAEVERFIVESYRRIASKKRLAELDAQPAKKTVRSARPRAKAKVVAKTPRKRGVGKNGRTRQAS